MHLLLRADANSDQGTGHVMRCLALAQAWRDTGGMATLATTPSDLDLSPQFRNEGVNVVTIAAAHPDTRDAAEVLALAKRVAPVWIVVDGYQFSAEYGGSLRATGARLLRIDDHGTAAPYDADVLLDPNVGAARPEASSNFRTLTGPKYALLRREFAKVAPGARAFAPGATRVLVTLGGAPDRAVVASAIEAIGRLNGVEGVVLAGRSASRPVPPNVRVLERTDDMRALMEWADVAVSAAGSTASELAALGVPAILVATVPNQGPVAAALSRAGAALEIPLSAALDADALAKAIGALLADPARREQLSLAGRALVDCRGAAAVVTDLLSDLVDLRAATSADARAVWELANEPVVRSASFRTDLIPWETHVAWFARRLADATSPIYLAWDERGLVGQVRFDAMPAGPEIGVAVAPAARGRGLGGAIIRAGVRRWVRSGGPRPVHAWIRPDNAASVRAFERAGFRSCGRAHHQGVQALHFAFEHEEI